MIKYYADYMYPGFLFGETSTKEIKKGETFTSPDDFPHNCYAITTYEVEVKKGRGGKELRSAPDKHKTYWIGKWYTLDQIAAGVEDGKRSILYVNVQNNSDDGKAIKCRPGNWQIPEKGDVVVEVG